VTPAGTPDANAGVAIRAYADAKASDPPPVGIDCVMGVDVAPESSVVLTEPPPQLATISPPETRTAAVC
jgi:hypothetical protein